MKISGKKTVAIQELLFKNQYCVPVQNYGQARTLVGKWGEYLTKIFLGAERHKTDSTCDYCPDLSVNGVFLESKVCGKSNQTFVYSGRLDRDWLFSRSYDLWYCVWSHSANILIYEDVSDLLHRFIRSLQAVYLVPFWAMYSICRRCRCSKLNSKYYGAHSSNPEYGSGYRVSLSSLSDYEIILV